MEAIVGTVIAVIAIFGLANSFGTGRALVNRYEVARIAAGVAQGRLERLYLEPPGSPLLKLGAHDTLDVVIDGRPVLRDTWTVDKYDDPANPHKVILNGQACGDVTQDLGASVSIVIGCPTLTK